MKNINIPSAIVFAVLVVGGVVALVFKQDVVGASLVGAALGLLGKSPVGK